MSAVRVFVIDSSKGLRVEAESQTKSPRDYILFPPQTHLYTHTHVHVVLIKDREIQTRTFTGGRSQGGTGRIRGVRYQRGVQDRNSRK